jgi:hypothetical protein
VTIPGQSAGPAAGDGLFLVAGAQRSPLAEAAFAGLCDLAVPAVRLTTATLASAPLTVAPDGAAYDGEPVAGALFLDRPGASFSAGFAAEDRSFADNETRAAWAGLLASAAVWTVNRTDADLWFTSAEGPIWRRRLAADGVPVAPLTVGGEPGEDDRGWLPHTGGGVGPLPRAGSGSYLAAAYAALPEAKAFLRCQGRWIGGGGSAAGERVAEAMAARGYRFFGGTLDGEDRLVRLTAFPEIDDDGLAAEAGRRIAEAARADRARR